MYVIIEKNEIMLLPKSIKRDKKIIISTTYYECTDLLNEANFYNYSIMH